MSDRETACTPDCNRPRVGSRAEHCKVCHRTFAGTSAGDSHRVGTPGTEERRCRTAEELLDGGMWASQSAVGPKWHGVWNKRGEQKRRGTGTYGEDAE